MEQYFLYSALWKDNLKELGQLSDKEFLKKIDEIYAKYLEKQVKVNDLTVSIRKAVKNADNLGKYSAFLFFKFRVDKSFWFSRIL